MEEPGRVNITRLKESFISRYPSHPLSRIFVSEPDILTATELVAKSQTWLAFLQGEDENE
jgi:hypothetical protein